MPNRKAKSNNHHRSEVSKAEFLSNARIALANQAPASELEEAVPSFLRQFTPKPRDSNADGGSLRLRVATRKDLNDSEIEVMYKLLRCNMKPSYDISNTPWNDQVKFDEVNSDGARFLMALGKRDTKLETESCQATSDLAAPSTSFIFGDEELAAFAHLRFETEEQHIAATYVYELQVAPAFRGLGIGSWLLSCAQSINSRFQLSRLLLTVFKFNADALRFYEKVGFELDETNPAAANDDRFDYLILSRTDRNAQKLAQSSSTAKAKVKSFANSTS